jgi:hypothetical protein
VVVMRAARAPVRSIRLLATRVVPWMMRAMLGSSMPPCVAKRASPSSTPTEGSDGVVRFLKTETLPSSSMATKSVKVPPTSTPTECVTERSPIRRLLYEPAERPGPLLRH